MYLNLSRVAGDTCPTDQAGSELTDQMCAIRLCGKSLSASVSAEKLEEHSSCALLGQDDIAAYGLPTPIVRNGRAEAKIVVIASANLLWFIGAFVGRKGVPMFNHAMREHRSR